MVSPRESYPPIKDYALISDCHCVGLISRSGSVDWCCMSRIDNDSNFARLLDWQRGGFWSITPIQEEYESSRHYEPETLVLTTEFRTPGGKARLYDFFAVPGPGETSSPNLHVRIAEGISGEVELAFRLSARFDYGAVIPCVHQHAETLYAAWGSNQGLIVYSDTGLQIVDNRNLETSVKIRPGQRLRFSARSVPPERLNDAAFAPPESSAYLDQQLEQSLAWWRQWTSQVHPDYRDDPQTLRSALILKGLTFEQTGAVAAAATTSLPEWLGGERNWDYRYSWIRDSVFTVRALHELGFMREADRFAEFIERSAAGSGEQLQTLFGVDGKRRLVEIELPWLEGYRGSRPVRIGNTASKQLQLDAYGELMELAWIRHCHGSGIGTRYWRFLADIVEVASKQWNGPDHGIWEMRTEPLHFVFSKALCWSAVNRGIQLARHYGFAAPMERWARTRDEIRAAIERHGYDSRRGIFRQAFGNEYADASLLLLPWFHFVDYGDPRMIRTTEAICRELDDNGLLKRYNSPDGLSGSEGVFVPCTFWLVDCLARQGRMEEALQYYKKASSCVNDLGLFSEEFDAQAKAMLGNFPQGLTHVSQIIARLAIDSADGAG